MGYHAEPGGFWQILQALEPPFQVRLRRFTGHIVASRLGHRVMPEVTNIFYSPRDLLLVNW